MVGGRGKACHLETYRLGDLPADPMPVPGRASQCFVWNPDIPSRRIDSDATKTSRDAAMVMDWKRTYLVATTAVAAGLLPLTATPGLAAAASDRGTGAPAIHTVHLAQPASAFTDSVGVNIHASYSDTPYADSAALVNNLSALGVGHVRDGIKVGRSDVLNTWNSLAATGIRSDLIMGDPQNRYGVGTIDQETSLLAGPLSGSVESAEAPNEWDCSGSPTWAADLHSYQHQLSAAMQANPMTTAVPLVGPSFCRTAAKYVYGADGVSQVANDHAYAGGGPPESTVDSEVASTRTASGLSSIVITETGYNDALLATTGQPGVPDDVAAAYDLRTLLEAFRLGVSRTYLYELYDEFSDPAGVNAEAHYGLMNYDGTPKPAYTAIQSLLGLLSDQPGSARATLNYGLTSGSTVDQVVLGRTDGSADLILWQPASIYDTSTHQRLSPTTTLAHLRLSAPADITAAHPAVTGTQEVSYGTSLRVVGVPVGADPIVLHITPHRGAPRPAPAPLRTVPIHRRAPRALSAAPERAPVQ